MLDITESKRTERELSRYRDRLEDLVRERTAELAKEATPLFEDTNIRDILRMLKNEFSAQLSIRRIQWIEPETEVEIKADRLCLVRLFRNLIDNSLKYGGERLSKIWIGHEDTQDSHIFSVADNGKGIDEVDTERIFRLFQRRETSRGIEGAGLGLAIVKEITEKHGGSVWVEAGAKRGITFYISISKHL